MDKLGYDGVGFNEHHCSPYGLMNSPNLMAAAAAQRTQEAQAPDLRQPAAAARAAAAGRRAGDARLPVERPADLRLRARHPARIQASTTCRLTDSRARFEEACEIVTPRLDGGDLLLRGQILVLQGRRDLAAPGAAAAPADLGAGRRQQGDDRVGRQRNNVADHAGARPRRPAARTSSATTRNASPSTATGSRPTICRSQASAYVADSKAAGGARVRRPTRSTSTARCSATATSPRPPSSATPATCSQASFDYVRPGEHEGGVAATARGLPRHDDGGLRARGGEDGRWGRPRKSTERIISAADAAGANTVLISMNRGAMPHEMFMEQIRRFAPRCCRPCRPMKWCASRLAKISQPTDIRRGDHGSSAMIAVALKEEGVFSRRYP